MSCETKTTCPYCGVGCGVIAAIDDQGKVSVRGDPDHPANHGRLCSKGSALAETLDLEGRGRVALGVFTITEHHRLGDLVEVADRGIVDGQHLVAGAKAGLERRSDDRVPEAEFGQVAGARHELFGHVADDGAGGASGDRHAGDLPNLVADAQGRAVYKAEVKGLKLATGADGILGRSVVVHADPDDYQSQPAGNSGARQACGVIQAG